MKFTEKRRFPKTREERAELTRLRVEHVLVEELRARAWRVDVLRMTIEEPEDGVTDAERRAAGVLARAGYREVERGLQVQD
jgi:hypothetical protein